MNYVVVHAMTTKNIIFMVIITISTLQLVHSKEESANQVSKQCDVDIKSFKANLKNLTTWAVEIWESTGKPLSILRGNHYQIGDFDECVESSEGFKRQYCLVKLKLYSSDRKEVYNNIADILLNKGNMTTLKRNQLFWGWCGPASCSKRDVEILLTNDRYLSRLFKPANIVYEVELDKNSCQTDQSDTPFTVGSIAFICCFFLLLTMALSSTMIQWHSERTNSFACPDYIKSFSIINSVEQLYAKDEPCLRMTYGLRVLATIYIVGTHYFGTVLLGPIQNRLQLEILHRKWYGSLAIQLMMAFVDVFFVLGGFFAVYSLCKKIGKKSAVEVVVARLVRILPLYLFLLFFIVTILPQTGSGPMWGMMMNEIEYCQRNWWTNLLFINNYVKSTEPCMGNTWYIACDFQFYLLALALCYFLADPKKEKTGLKIIGFLLVLSILIPAFITYVMELAPTLYLSNALTAYPRAEKTMQNRYITSHTRMAPSLLGMLTAYIVMKLKITEIRKIKPTVSTVVFFSSVLIFIGNTLFIFMVFDIEPPYDPLTSGIYAGLHRPINGLCVCAMILICIFGYVPWVDHLLSSTPMIVLGKLTFGTYMISLIIQLRGEGVIRQSVYFDYGGSILTSVGYLINSFFLSFLGYILIEAPFNGLYKLLTTPSEKLKKINEKS